MFISVDAVQAHATNLTNLRTLHLFVLALWGGVLASEGVLELLPLRRPELRPATVVFHYFIDLLVELPLLLGILLTGALLLHGRPFTGLVAAKVACGSIAVLANLACIVFVVKRRSASANLQAIWTRRIYASALVGVPAGVGALILGAWLARWIK